VRARRGPARKFAYRDVVPDPPTIALAATVVLLRDGPEGPETLMVLRSRELKFAGGHWVFPGGRLEAADLGEGAETREETGLVLDPASLVWFAHWTPPPMVTLTSGRQGRSRRFATWFFVAPAPGGSVAVDGGEIRDHTWVRPADALARRDAGDVELSPPTWVTLWQLTAHPDVAAAVAHGAGGVPERFTTRMVRVDDHQVALWHGDAGYEAGDPAAEGPRHRLVMHPDGWTYQRD
jgi:8-oxo-dGTP pyrophosphatase MutT (NUDIX family)